jgi:hypothetical protein
MSPSKCFETIACTITLGISVPTAVTIHALRWRNPFTTSHAIPLVVPVILPSNNRSPKVDEPEYMSV